MPDMNALDLLKEIQAPRSRIPVIIITGQGDEETAVAALKLGAYDYIVKRDNYLTQLPYAIDHAIARRRLIDANRRLQNELAERNRAEAENARLLAEVLAQRRRLDEIVASVPGIVWEMRGRPDDPAAAMHFVSDHAVRMLGYSLRAVALRARLLAPHRSSRRQGVRGAAGGGVFHSPDRAASAVSAGLPRTDGMCGSRPALP